MTRGKLIVFESFNGSGKTFYANKIIEKYPNIIYLKFPNRQSKTGILINKFLKKEINLTLLESKQLFIDNIFEWKKYIIDNLNNGKNIICDRYIISTITYQYMEIIKNIYNNNIIDNNTILSLLDITKSLPKPDIIFLINGNHIQKRNENQQLYHFDKHSNLIIFNNFITILTLLNDNWLLIDNTDIINNTEKNIKKIYNYINSINVIDNINFY